MRRILFICFFVGLPVFVSAQQEDLSKKKKAAIYYADYIATQRFTDIVGSWEKKFTVEDGKQNRDQKWTLTLIFQSDGQFIYNNSFIQEVRFRNKIGEETTRPISQDAVLKGTYRIVNSNLYLDFMTNSLTDIETLALSLNLNRLSRQVVARVEQQSQFLVLQEIGSPRQIFLERTFD